MSFSGRVIVHGPCELIYRFSFGSESLLGFLLCLLCCGELFPSLLVGLFFLSVLLLNSSNFGILGGILLLKLFDSLPCLKQLVV